MGFLNSLLGDISSEVWTVVAALLIAIVLVVFLVWLLKFALNASRTVARGRNRRIGVTESVMVDTKRQLVLIRRDDVEHLVLTGGPQDLVVESNIPLIPEPVAVPSRRAPPVPGERRAGEARQRPAGSGEAPVAASSLRPSFAAVSPAAPVPAERPAPPAASEEPELPSNVSPIEKLRQLGQRPAARAIAALRYPGLLRPITRHRGIEPVPANRPDPIAAEADAPLPPAPEAGEQAAANEADDGAKPNPKADKQTSTRG
ncbi:MAG: hypothetical protein WEB63_11920 [Cucumibacter sp.]